MLKEPLLNHIGFGGGKLSVMPTLKSALNILETAFDNGINHFDTAPIYGSGYSEKIVGKFASNKRSKILIATKVGLNPLKEYRIIPSLALPINYLKQHVKKGNKLARDYNPGIIEYRLITKKFIQDSFEKSLRNLKTDYVDYYLLHEALPTFLEDEGLAYLDQLRTLGHVKKIGVATSSINYLNLPKSVFDSWNVLQYEFSPKGTSQTVHDLYPEKEQIVHSIIINTKSPGQILPEKDRAGYLLAKHLKSGLANKVLFSTSKVETLLTNISALNLYS